MIDTMTTSKPQLNVAIVGGGISGLSTAWYLQKQAAEHQIDLTYTVLEKSDRWGGKILTDVIDSEDTQPFVVEGGPDSFLTQKPWALQLAQELGVEERLIGTNDEQRQVYVVVNGKPVPLPEGVLLIVPTKFMPFVMSPLISPLGKLRMGLDLLIPPKVDDEDETLAQFIVRRLGREALDKIAEPLMSGIYNADADKQSIMATFPRFRTIEKQHGSLIRGMLTSMRKRAAASTQSPTPKRSAFMSLQGGTNELINALVPQLTGNLRLKTGVKQIKQSSENGYLLSLEDNTVLNADVVIMTSPAYVTSKLVQALSPVAANTLNSIRYVSTGTITVAFKKADVKRPLNGFGLVIPSSENRPINAITVSSTKFNHRAPDDMVLMRIFFGGSRSPESMHLDDDHLLKMVRNELRMMLGIEADPLFHRIYRWWNANPQYDIGHLERVDRIESSLPRGLYVTGSAYRGVGMPDCVHQSLQTVDKIFSNLPVSHTSS